MKPSVLDGLDRDRAVERLTALWALNEAGLGGLIHAMRVPFTGIVVGSTAVVLIALIAFFAEKKAKAILKATVIVLLIKAAASPHHFLSVTKAGHSAIVSTNGNEDCHLILRGGQTPNYDAAAIDAACNELGKSGLAARVMVDFSHANSRKQFRLQLDVARDVGAQMAAGEERVFGVMIESHLNEGRQDLTPGKPLAYGVSVTDACLGWEDSLAALAILADAVKQRRVALAVR